MHLLNVKEQNIQVKTISLEKSEILLLNSEFLLSKSDIFTLLEWHFSHSLRTDP